MPLAVSSKVTAILLLLWLFPPLFTKTNDSGSFFSSLTKNYNFQGHDSFLINGITWLWSIITVIYSLGDEPQPFEIYWSKITYLWRPLRGVLKVSGVTNFTYILIPNYLYWEDGISKSCNFFNIKTIKDL